MSHPAWVCGLKLEYVKERRIDIDVTPCVGVWIETYVEDLTGNIRPRHTLRGCVD